MIDHLKPQDLFVALKVLDLEADWTNAGVAESLGMSPSEVGAALRRLEQSRLYAPRSQRRIVRPRLLELLLHGVGYMYPAQIGGPVRGVATALGVAPLEESLLIAPEDRLVWPSSEGADTGLGITPLYSTVPGAARRDPKLHERLALVDLLRVGRARERALAARALKQRLSA